MPSGGGEILREGDEGNYTYRVLEGRENRPVLFVAAVDAMRMANWLNNGAQQDGDTENGSYTFTGYDTVSKRNANARWVLPSDDEWYKAAYYDPTKNGTGGFWQYSPRTDDPNKMLAELPPGGPFSANFNSIPGTDGNGTTDVGAYTAAASFYGTFDQSGLSWEWNEPLDPTTKRASRRGGSQGNNVARIAAGAIADNAITKGGASANQSFRLALVTPSPAPVPAVLTVTRVSATQVRVTWTGSGVLQSTTAIGAPWTNVPGNPANTHDVTVGEGSVLFRVVSP
jgi:formylglycine-generating enzyme required for sulfatase activity